ncbi:tRNA (guanosine(46)-N(7))-methyltransferase TrmB [Amaricoccus sp.]|uniref:tRNA (guanine(46)-N(7))-methyltransferase TrmB n=1 Tax=Amaricoccus sp. TaxID=1872485 RepID=UPI001B743342|nr:tRNA (guanine(46)-N(7))-methyltransferase TrmB [Amaricoccus sp.]MBP7241075.1 tRNA (guanosine(46)-N7)-methyltransferase TrmB [Amaricoccus sp.]
MTEAPPVAGERPQPARKFYGRRHGKALRPAQARLVEDLLPRLAIPGAARQGDPARAPVDPAALFGDDRPVWLEIGFGAGEHLAHQAALHPGTGFLGAEPFVNGVAAFLGKVEARGLANIRIHPGDARDLVELLPPASLSRVFLLYPDPWPKTRHRDRRFMSPENLALLVRAMAPGAELRLATDIPDYVAHALAAVAASGFRREERDPATPWPDWTRTRYEAKALREGRTPAYLSFRRA